MAGILDLYGNPGAQGILGMAGGLLNAAGPQFRPVSFGQALGQGLQQGNQAFQQARQAQLQQQLLGLRAMEAQRQANAPINVSPGGVLLDPNTRQPIFTAPFKPEVPEAPKAPTTRKVRIGNEEVTQEFDPTTMQWREVGRGPAFSNKPLVEIINKAEDKYATEVSGMAAKRDSAQFDAATAAPENIIKLDSLIQHLQTSDALTGPLAEWKLKLEQARQLITNDVKAGKTVSDTQILDAALGSDVFPMISSLGIGARGMDTPAEREFLRKVMTGTIELNKEALIKMAEVRRSIAERVIEKWNKRVESGELDRYFKYTGTPKQKIEMPKPTPEPQKPQKPSSEFVAGRIYRDAAGNQARYLGNGKWQEIK